MYEVIIIGGGPGGLLAGHFFRQNDVPYMVLEKDLIGSSFRKMRPDMILLSPAVPGADWTSLTLKYPIWALSGVNRPFPTRDDFVCYLDTFARDNEILVRENSPVETIEKKDKGFTIHTPGNSYSAKFVLLATGFYAIPRYPDFAGINGNPYVLHYADFFNCRAYQGLRVLVVGSGNSAAELAIDLSGLSKVTLLTRGQMRFFSQTEDLADIRGYSESVLKELIKFGIIEHIWEEAVVELQENRVIYDSGREETFDKVIFATGFSPSTPPLSGAEIECKNGGLPVITGAGESVSAEGIFFAGSLAMFHSRCKFIHGFRNEVERVTWAIFDRL